MPLTSDQWRRLYGAFDPKHRLEVTELDRFVERPGSVARSIAEALEDGLEQRGKWLICGSYGSGKSTELVKLASLLHTNHRVIGVDLGTITRSVEELSPAEILFCIGAAAIGTARRRWNHSVPSELIARLEAVFGKLMVLPGPSRSDERGPLIDQVAEVVGDAFIPGFGQLTGKVSEVTRGLLGGLTPSVSETDGTISELREAVNEVLRDIGANQESCVILVDGLDKLQKLERIQALFIPGISLTSPVVPIVYTAPVTLMISPQWNVAGDSFSREPLTNLAVWPPRVAHIHISEKKIRAARQAVRDVIAHRCTAVGLEIHAVFAPDSLELLTDMCGGVMRKIMHLVQRAIAAARLLGSSSASTHIFPF